MALGRHRRPEGPTLGPTDLAWTEQALAALDGTRLTGADRMDAVILLAGHVRGIAQQARNRRSQMEERGMRQITPALLSALPCSQ